MSTTSEMSAFEFRRRERARLAHYESKETLIRSEKRRMLAEAVDAFRETQKAWSFDKDVIQLIAERGSIPFDVWMNSVLYGPDGYYTSGRCKINSGDFSTITSDPEHVMAFYFAIVNYLLERGRESPEHSLVSVASGAGNFEELFSQIHRYAATADPEYALPVDTHLMSVDISEKNLVNQLTDRTTKQLELIHNTFITEGDAIMVNDSIKVPFSLLWDVCKKFDCVGSLITEGEYRTYYQNHILPYLKTHASPEVYACLASEMTLFRVLAPFFTSTASTLVAGSAFELPFARGSVDTVFSNELHDAFPSKVFVADVDKNEFEELHVGYDHEHNIFTLLIKPLDPVAQKMLDLKLRYVCDQRTPVPFSPELKKDFLVVNGASLAYMLEAARVLKPGGLLINADYVPHGDTKNNELLRLQYNDDWVNLFSNISYYTAPWLDVTTDMNAAFLEWLAEAMGLTHRTTMNQKDFTQSMTGVKGGIELSDSFVCQFFEKK